MHCCDCAKNSKVLSNVVLDERMRVGLIDLNISNVTIFRLLPSSKLA